MPKLTDIPIGGKCRVMALGIVTRLPDDGYHQVIKLSDGHITTIMICSDVEKVDG